MPPTGFDDKLLARLPKLDPAQLREFVARLVAQKQFLLNVFDHLAEGVIVTGGDLRIDFINRRARQMLGWPRGRAYEGEQLLVLLPTEHPLHATFESLRALPRELDGIECTYGRKGDRVLSLTTLLMPLPLAESNATELRRAEPALQDELGEQQLILLLSDVTERRRRMSEQARARRLASLATLTSGIAHEIKNPLNSLNIHAQLLQGEVEDARRTGQSVNADRAERAVNVILEETGRLARIIEEFLQAARPRSPRLEPTSLQELFERAERIFSPECERAGIALSVTCEADIPPVMLDEHLLLQALRNLVRNAVEAVTEKADRAQGAGEDYAPWVRMSAELAGDHVTLRIADNGTGIPENALEHIFEPYFTTKFSGTGLGLMVVYRIVTEHRGTLHVDTQPGEGTQFVIALPLHQRPVRLLAQAEGNLPRALLAHETPNVPALRPTPEKPAEVENKPA
jgi:signal transduction histidine kinase